MSGYITQYRGTFVGVWVRVVAIGVGVWVPVWVRVVAIGV